MFEGREVKKSYFSGQVAYAQEDPSVQVLESCSQQFLARMSQEITRSIVTYKRLKKGKATDQKMYLSGRGTLLNKLPEYLSETQRFKYRLFRSTKECLISEKVDENMRLLLPYIAGEPIGLACAIFKNIIGKNLKDPINLLPESKLANLILRKKVSNSFIFCSFIFMYSFSRNYF